MDKDLFFRFKEQLQQNGFASKMEDLLLCNHNNITDENIKVSDRELKDIIDTRDVKLKVSKFYLYSKRYELNDDIRKEIEKQLEKNNVKVYYSLEVIEKYYTLGRKDAIDFVRAISNSQFEYQARCAKDVALEHSIYTRDDAIKFVEAIANTRKFFQTEYSKETALDINVLKNKKAITLVNLVASSSFEYQAKYSFFAATNLQVLKRADAVDLVRTISTSLMPYQAKYSSFIATDENVLKRDDALEIVGDVASAKDELDAKKMVNHVISVLEKEKTENSENSKVKIKK